MTTAPTRPIPELAAIAKERCFRALITKGLIPAANPTPQAKHALQAMQEALSELNAAAQQAKADASGQA